MDRPHRVFVRTDPQRADPIGAWHDTGIHRGPLPYLDGEAVAPRRRANHRSPGGPRPRVP